MLRFEGDVFLFGTAIAAPALQLTKKLATNPRLSSTGVSLKRKIPRRRSDRREGASYSGLAGRCKRGHPVRGGVDSLEKLAMTLLPVTLATAAAAAVLHIWLSMRVVLARAPLKISVGDGGSEAVLRRMRAHANFAENMPIFLIMLFALDLAGANRTILFVVAIAFVLARIAHGLGMDGGSLVRLRSVGMITSTLAILGLAVYAIVLAAA
jgi:uncharacterized membrane protein YecN with MAPEG domain